MFTSSLIKTVHSFLLFENEKKLEALLVYSSFVRVAIVVFWNGSLFTSSGSILCSNKE